MNIPAANVKVSDADAAVTTADAELGTGTALAPRLHSDGARSSIPAFFFKSDCSHLRGLLGNCAALLGKLSGCTENL